jgi:tetratricopeptide (TPR) repeat protein
MHSPAILALAAVMACAAATSSAGASLVLGGGQAHDCYEAARASESAEGRSSRAIETCTRALETEALSLRDRAGTLVNRGILRMARREYALALDDYAAALRLAPGSGVAHVNRGAALIALGQAADGVAAIDRGLALSPDEPEKAYFNRGYGREQLGDLKGAYGDFTRAAELRPDWDLPRRELARFTVRRPGDG